MIFWLFFIPFFMKSIKSSLESINYKIIHTPISNILPIKLHHIVLLYNNNGMYSVDFTPKQTKTFFLQLLFGQNILGEIRVRDCKHFEGVDYEKMFGEMNMWNMNYNDSVILTEKTLNNITDQNFKKLLTKIYTYPKKMNLYMNNCQHFSHFVTSFKEISD